MDAIRPITFSRLIPWTRVMAGAVLALSTGAARLEAQNPRPVATESDAYRWADSVLTTMTLRDRAAQMVWPNIYADYVPADALSWRRVTSFVKDDKVGGIYFK